MTIALLAQDPLQQQRKGTPCGSCRLCEVITGTTNININYWNIIGQAIPDSQVISRRTPTEPTSGEPRALQMTEQDSSDNAFSFSGHAVAPAAGTQSNSSQSIDTGGSDASELRTSQPRRHLVAPRGRQISTMQAIEDRTAHLEREDHLHDNCRLR